MEHRCVRKELDSKPMDDPQYKLVSRVVLKCGEIRRR